MVKNSPYTGPLLSSIKDTLLGPTCSLSHIASTFLTSAEGQPLYKMAGPKASVIPEVPLSFIIGFDVLIYRLLLLFTVVCCLLFTVGVCCLLLLCTVVVYCCCLQALTRATLSRTQWSSIPTYL